MVAVAGTKVTVLDAVVAVLAHDSIPYQDSMIQSVTLASMLSVDFKKLQSFVSFNKPAACNYWLHAE